MSSIFELSKYIETFVRELPEHIETIESLIHNYNQLLSENKELKQKNKRLQKNLQKYKKIPCVPCTIIT
jgi:regulator of replication initiation timing